MKAAFLLLTLGLVLTLAAPSKPSLSPAKKETNTYYYLQGLRGFWLGYEKGFYKNNKRDISQTCLDDGMVNDVLELIDFFTVSMDPSKFFQVFTQAMEVMNTFKACAVESTFTDVLQYCQVYPQKCSSSAIMDNLTKNMFVLMGKMTEVSEIMTEFPAEDVEEFNAQMNSLGLDFGTVLRVVLAFQG